MPRRSRGDEALPARALRRYATAGDDRAGARGPPQAASPTNPQPHSTSPCSAASSSCSPSCAPRPAWPSCSSPTTSPWSHRPATHCGHVHRHGGRAATIPQARVSLCPPTPIPQALIAARPPYRATPGAARRRSPARARLPRSPGGRPYAPRCPLARIDMPAEVPPLSPVPTAASQRAFARKSSCHERHPPARRRRCHLSTHSHRSACRHRSRDPQAIRSASSVRAAAASRRSGGCSWAPSLPPVGQYSSTGAMGEGGAARPDPPRGPDGLPGSLRSANPWLTARDAVAEVFQVWHSLGAETREAPTSCCARWD